MKILTTVLGFLLLLIRVYPQEITKHEADSLLHVLIHLKPGIERAHILLRMAQFQIFKPGENKIDFDSAIGYIKEAERLNKKIKSVEISGYQLLTESFMLREQGKDSISRQMVEKVIAIMQAGNNKYYLGKAYFTLSSYYDYRDDPNFPLKVKLVENAAKAFHESKSIKDEADALRMLGDLYHISGDINKSIQVITQSIASYHSIDYKELQGVYDLLGNIYYMSGDYKNAIQYELMALKTACLVRDSSMQMCKISLTLGSIYVQLSRSDIANRYFRDALKIAIRNNDQYAVVLSLSNISRTLVSVNKAQEMLNLLPTIPAKFLSSDRASEKCLLARIYMENYLSIREHKKAKNYLDTLLSYVDNPTVPPNIKCFTYQLGTALCLETSKIKKARYYLSMNDPIVINMAIPSIYASNERLWYKVDSADGRYQSAFRHLLAYKTNSDSLFNETKSRQFQQLEVEYETAKKEDSIKFKNQDIVLLKQTNHLQMRNLQQANLIKNISTGGIILAVITITLLFRQYKNKLLSNQVISGKNEKLQRLLDEKEWLLKEVHHRVKNNLQTVVSLLELQADTLGHDARAAIQASQNRIYAASLLHQKLYQDENVSSVDMAIYIKELVEYLKDVHNISNNIVFNLKISPFNLDISQAIPVGLIINEMITNSIKYAFKASSKQPEITIAFEKGSTGLATLIISDNGSGFVLNKEENMTGLGLKLVEALTEDLESETIIESTEGTRLHVRFPLRSILPHTPEPARNNAVEAELVSANILTPAFR